MPYLGQTVVRDEAEADMVLVSPMKLADAELERLWSGPAKRGVGPWAYEC